MTFEKIYDAMVQVGTPHAGDLILFQIEDGRWTAAIYPILAQKMNADEYDGIEEKALQYAVDAMDRGKLISVWKEEDANKNKYTKIT